MWETKPETWTPLGLIICILSINKVTNVTVLVKEKVDHKTFHLHLTLIELSVLIPAVENTYRTSDSPKLNY